MPVPTLPDIEQIKQLKQLKQLKPRYFRMIDTKDWDGFANVSTPDVSINVTAEGGTITSTVGEFVTSLRSSIEAVTTVHHESYRRTSDGWRIATMSLTCLRRDLEFG